MPLGIPDSVRQQPRADAAPPPPSPGPGFLAGLTDLNVVGANVNIARDDIPGHLDEERDGAYTSLISALTEKGMSPARYYIATPAMQLTSARPGINYDLALQDAQRLGISGVPATREAFDQQWQHKMLQRQQRDQATAARGGTAARLVGGMAGAMTDPVNVSTLPFGGFGRSIATKILTEGLVQAGVQGAELPFVNVERGRQGRPALTGQEEAMSIASAAAGGAVLRGAAELPGGAATAFERAVSTQWDRLPEALRQRWQARASLPAPDQDELVADVAENLIGPERMSEHERAAAHVIRREAQIDATSPFMPDGAGASAHRDMLSEALARIVADNPRTVPVGPTVGMRRFDPAEGLAGLPQGDTAISTGTVPSSAVDVVMQRIGHAENATGSATIKNPRSSASGLYQFTDGTWVRMFKARFGEAGLSKGQILARKSDLALQQTLMRDLTQRNAAALSHNGVPVTPGNLYLAHFAGDGGAVRLHEAAPGASAESVLGRKVVEANPFLGKMTAGDVIAWADRRMGGAGVAVRGIGAPRLADGIDAEAGAIARMRDEVDALHADNARIAASLNEPAAGEADPLAGLGETPSNEPDVPRVTPVETPLPEDLEPPASARSYTPPRRIDMVRFVAQQGGLSYDGFSAAARERHLNVDNPPLGHDLRNTGYLNQFVPGAGPLLRPGGRGLDEMGELLHEAGFFGAPELVARPTEREVIDTLDQVLRSGEKRYTEGGAPDEVMPKLDRHGRTKDEWLADEREAFTDRLLAEGAHPEEVASYPPEVLDAAADQLAMGRSFSAEGALESALTFHYDSRARRLAKETQDATHLPIDNAERDALIARFFGDDGEGDGAGSGGRAGEPGDARQGGAAGESHAGPPLAALTPEQRAPLLDPDGAAAKAQAESLIHDAKAALDHGEAVDPNAAALDKQRGRLGAEAPLQAKTDQESTLGFGLFGAADGVRLDANGEARPLKDLLDDIEAEQADLKTIRDCL